MLPKKAPACKYVKKQSRDYIGRTKRVIQIKHSLHEHVVSSKALRDLRKSLIPESYDVNKNIFFT